MASDLSLQKVNRFVLVKQRLAGERAGESLVETVRATGGLHATSASTPYLSLFARVKDFRRELLDDALYVKRSLGKIRYVRTTVHILPRDFIPIALAATRTINEPASHAYSQFLGVTQKQYAEMSLQIVEILKGNNGMTTRQVRQKLKTTLNVSPIVNLMCDKGLLIRGAPEKGWKSNIHTYYLLNEYFPDLEWNIANENDAKKAVVLGYLSSFGPVTENDISWWTGFNKGQIRPIIRELRKEITSITVSGIDKEFIMLSQDRTELVALKAGGKHILNMLPTLDPYLMGYKDRERFLDSTHFDYIYDRGGNAVATVLLDGRVIGVWDFEEPFIKIFLFDYVGEDVLKDVYAKARSLGTFISGRDVKVKECTSMIPLTQRTAGGFLSPLK